MEELLIKYNNIFGKSTSNVREELKNGPVVAVLSSVPDSQKDLNSLSRLEKSLQFKWITYICSSLCNASSKQELWQRLAPVDASLQHSQYLCGTRLSAADLLLAVLLQPLLAACSLLQKEHYQNLSRWYGCVQTCALLQHLPRVLFSRTVLYAGGHH